LRGERRTDLPNKKSKRKAGGTPLWEGRWKNDSAIKKRGSTQGCLFVSIRENELFWGGNAAGQTEDGGF